MRGAIVAVFVVALAGCTVTDPTESTFSARFLNNLGYDAKIGMCSNETTCRGGLEYDDRVRRGQSIEENISSDGYVQPFRVERDGGGVVGCLFVVATHYKRHLVIPLSRMTACPGPVLHVA
jgi:hypothetical protein